MTVNTPHAPAPAVVVDGVSRLKIVIGGGFGVGKTTAVGAVSEIEPLCTEETMTAAGTHTDSLHGVPDKTSTTVALDFGRLTLGPRLQLFLFGMTGQDRFKELWHEYARGAVGAVVLADTRRLADSFDVITFAEYNRLPFVVAVNEFPDAHPHHLDDVRDALGVDADVPVVACDARERASVASVLITLVDHTTRRRPSPFPSLDTR
ncbi:ATP/GTP-binding protein [Streptomyces sp. NPDC004539]|uniref:GTP-binding protein n=1 Tax=Streptomyces sp. NPDC004539 TaxID=3154280 RepID=UPI0033AA0C34